MTSGGYAKSKGRATHSSFFGLPKEVMAHSNFIRLTPAAVKLLNDIGFQYNGRNNGNLCAAYTVMQKRGWRSKETLASAIDCAKHYKMIMVTRQGGSHLASLYAITWRPINECNGKLDIPESGRAPGTWKDEQQNWASKSKQGKLKRAVRKSGRSGTVFVLKNPKTGEKWRVLPRKSGRSGRIPSVYAPKTVLPL